MSAAPDQAARAQCTGAQRALEALLADVRACRYCVTSPDTVPLSHAPRPVVRGQASARIAVCGQAPGTRVHASGVPFSDPSGVRLRAWMGVTTDEFYDESRIAIVPMGFCFPGHDAAGGDLPPRPECARLWRRRIFEHLSEVRLVLLVGMYAMRWHLGLGSAARMTPTVAEWRRWRSEPDAATPAAPSFLPLPHPSWRNNAWLKRNAWFEAELVPALQRDIRTLLGP